jgi:hypothetical protein
MRSREGMEKYQKSMANPGRVSPADKGEALTATVGNRNVHA